MTTATEHPAAGPNPPLYLFTEHELSRLMCLEATMAAEQYLVPLDQPVLTTWPPRRLAFGLLLRLTRRVSDGSER